MNEEQCERLVKAFEKIAASFEGLTDAVYTLEGAILDISNSIDRMNDKED